VIVYKVDTTIAGGRGSISILSNPTKIQSLGGGRPGIIGTMAVGESIQAEGFTIKVLKSVKGGDFVSISKS